MTGQTPHIPSQNGHSENDSTSKTAEDPPKNQHATFETCPISEVIECAAAAAHSSPESETNNKTTD